jgi:3-oxoacyl-[acyl-carrier protein] reductase
VARHSATLTTDGHGFPGGVKTEFAIGKGRTKKAVEQSGMLEPEDVATVALPACTQSPKSRIIEVQMRTMAEPLAG